MVLPLVTLLTNEFFFFSENILPLKDLFIINTSNFLLFFHISDNFLSIDMTNSELSTSKILINFIDQLENTDFLKNFENTNAIYHYSIPNVKLWYPEPFIASPSFMHSDLWFMHILIYQYWLWFVFIFIIVFFFITFISTVRWCNMRIRPRKETRGVSRSKCGDLITACVPVTWATSIIVNESTDAIDFYDGFGTTELVVGIRAYQWGWEYYYPKDVDLNHNIKNNYSAHVGNSLKYNKTTEINTNYNNFWKFYQNKTSDQILSAAHLIMTPINDYKFFNFLNFSDSGLNTSYEPTSFKRTKIFSKFNKNDLFYQPHNLFVNYNYLSNLYFNSDRFTDSLNLGTKNQINYLPLHSYLNSQTVFSNLKISQNFYNLNKTPLITDVVESKLPIFLKFMKKNYLPRFKAFRNEIKFIKNSLNLDLTKTPDTARELAVSFESVDNSNLHFLNSNKPTTKNFYGWPAFKNEYKSPQVVVSAEKLIWPVLSTDLFVDSKEYGSFNSVVVSDQKNVNNGTAITNQSWNSVLTFTRLNWKAQVNQNYLNILQKFYLPGITLYYDYDFKNLQSIQFLEDSFWESVLSAYVSDEYETMADEFYNDEYIDKDDRVYFRINMVPYKRGCILNEATESEDWVTEDLYSSPLLLEDNSSQFLLVNSKNFNMYANNNVNLIIDESYENLKNNLVFFNIFGQSSAVINSNINFLHHHTNVLDSFRSGFDSFAWLFDENNLNHDLKWLNGEFYNSSLKNYLEEYYLTKKNVNYDSETTDSLDILDYAYELGRSKTPKFSNLFETRMGAKGSILSFNALQKVFRPRFDEGRSHAKLDDFSYSYNKQQFISSFRTNYEKIIGKTHNNFFKISLFKNNFKTNYNYNYELNSSLNYFIFDFPFLLGLKSDASKHLWFDWYAKWGFYEVQPASASKYAIFGMPYLNKPFEFQQQYAGELNESENYLTRISRARRNYLTNWTQSPYLFAKNNSWFLDDYVFEIFEEIDNTLLIAQDLLQMACDSVDESIFENFTKSASYHFYPSHSGTTTFIHSDIRQKRSIQSYYYSATQLVDILSKREYLYRELLTLNKKIVALPNILTASANNPILSEIKMSFVFVDPINLNNEYSRSTYLSSIQYFNYLVFKSLLINIDENFGKSILINKIFSFLTNSNPNSNLINNNIELYKNQYRPMRRSVANMIRLHATGAMAMPTEIRLQLLASSKDVIHSWAVPSAGIKIDCVPGYSSHKVFLFLLSGIYWGQCMEICGRYHHWMPIIVYFMKRDLFFLWCTHFAYLNNYSLALPINDRMFADYAKQVSFNKYSWISEFL